jgi:small subunit ribosomal protein S1
MILSGLVVVVGVTWCRQCGPQVEAVIPLEQFKNERGNRVKAGDRSEVALDAMEDGTGKRLSREKAKRAAPGPVSKSFNKSRSSPAPLPVMKGGFTVEIDNVRAFLPGSLVDVRPVRDTAYLEGKSLSSRSSSSTRAQQRCGFSPCSG